MRRTIATLLCALEGAAACVLARCAVISHAHGSSTYAAVFSAVAIVLGLAIAHHAVMRDELRAALVRLERASRPAPMLTPAVTDYTVRAAMAGWCCDTAILTAGADHDPDTCTRKDQTT